MAMNLKKLAKQATTLSELCVGREKGDILTVAQYNDGKITIDKIDIVEAAYGTGYIFTVKEDKDNYYYATTIISKIFNSWIAEADGDISEVNTELKAQNIQFAVNEVEGTTSSRTYLAVEIVE